MFNTYSGRSHAREIRRKAIIAALPVCRKCHTAMFTITESRFHHSVKCPICGKTLTLRKRG